MHIPIQKVCDELKMHPNYLKQFLLQDETTIDGSGHITISLKCVMNLKSKIEKHTNKTIYKNKRKVSPILKKQIAHDQDWKCNICTRKLPVCYEVDHIVSLEHGGTNDSDNLQALCRNCHGNKTMEDQQKQYIYSYQPKLLNKSKYFL